MSFSPEIGQACFSNTEWQEHEAPEHLMLGLELLGTLLAGFPSEDGEGTISDVGIGSNAAQRFANNTFAMRDYCWCDGDVHPEGCPPNFYHYASGVRCAWYKGIQRSPSVNVDASPWLAAEILIDCIGSLKRGDYTCT